MRDLQYCDKCDHYYKTHCKCASKPETKPTPADDPSGQTLAGAGGMGLGSVSPVMGRRDAVSLQPTTSDNEAVGTGASVLEQFREAVECFRRVSIAGKRDCDRYPYAHDFDRSLEKADRLLAIIDTATSAGTTGDDSEDAARYRWLRTCGVADDRAIHTRGYSELLSESELDAAIDARRAREVGK